MSVKESVKAMRDEMKKLKADLRDKVKTQFYDEAKNLFVDHPTLAGFRWTQYTPYFNDGDTCEFGAHTDYPELKFVDAEPNEDAEDDEGYEEFYGNKNSPQAVVNKAVKEFLGAFEEDDYKHLFGDHVRVTVTREGVEVDEYSHD